MMAANNTSIILPRFRRDQWAIASHPAKQKFLCMGRRWGKTLFGGAAGLGTAAAGGKVAWAVPTYKNGRPLWRWVETSVALLKKRGLVSVNKTERILEFRNGGYLSVYSMDNSDSMRGEAFHLVIMDEAAIMPPVVYTDVVLPTLADYDGDLIAISTPRGRNWFFDTFTKAQADGVHMAAWTAPSSANPLPGIQRAFTWAEANVPSRSFQQEWLAQFLEDGAVFRNIEACIQSSILPAGETGRRYAIGVDLGKMEDYTVFVVADMADKAVVHIERSHLIDYTVQLQRLKELCERFPPEAVVIEVNIERMFTEQAQAAGLPVVEFTTTNASKQVLIEALILAFEQGAITIPRHDVLLAELRAFSAVRLPSGAIRYSAPSGMHDDTVMAMALAWHGVTQAGKHRMSFEFSTDLFDNWG